MMTLTRIPANQIIPTPDAADPEIAGIDARTGWTVSVCGHYWPGAVPDDVTVAKCRDFANFCLRLERVLHVRDVLTGSASWSKMAQSCATTNLRQFVGHIYSEDLFFADRALDHLLDQKQARLNGAALPDRNSAEEVGLRRALRSAYAAAKRTADYIEAHR